MNDVTAPLWILPTLDRSTIRVTGADRLAVLHNLCTNDVRGLVAGTGCEAFFTSVQGKTVGHGLIYCGAEDLHIITSPGQAATLIEHLDRYVIREDAQFEDLNDTLHYALLAGPAAEAGIHDSAHVALIDSPLAHTAVQLDSAPAIVRRCPLLPAALLLESTGGVPSWVTRQCARAGCLRLDDAAYTLRRILFGWPEYAIDMDARNLPQELNRDRQAISFHKGCYLGQETVARIDALGHVNQQLRGLHFLEVTSAPLPPGTTLRHDGQVVGHVTSSAAFRDRQAYALGYVKRAHQEAGTQFTTDHGVAQVVDLPVTDVAWDG